MPDEYVAVGGILNLWLSQNSSLPVAFEYTGGALGEISVTVLDYGRRLAVGSPDEVRNNQNVIDAYLGVAHDEQ